MRRGHGRIERALLAVLYATDNDLDAFELAAAAFELQPERTGRVGISPAQIGTIRRALGKLARDGLVVPVGSSKTQPGGGWPDRRAHWVSARGISAGCCSPAACFRVTIAGTSSATAFRFLGGRL